jgi:hypothetical protein
VSRRRWLNLYRGRLGTLAHPDAPAGGSGTGTSRPPRFAPVENHLPRNRIPHPDSPTGRNICHADILRFDSLERAECVNEALRRARHLVPLYIAEEIGQAAHEVITAVVPALLFGLGIIGVTTGFGVAAGAALGSLGGGIGVVPGAVFGANVGFESGMAFLDALGLGFLFVYISDKLPQVVGLFRDGVKRAWEAPDSLYGLEEMAINAAARDMARAVAVLFSLILQAIVAFMIAKSGQSGAERLPELIGKLRSSKMGEGFALWVERNYQSLIQDPNLRPGRKLSNGGGGGFATDLEEIRLSSAQGRMAGGRRAETTSGAEDASGLPTKPPSPATALPEAPPAAPKRAVGDFSNLKGATAKEILDAIPQEAKARTLTPQPGKVQEGIEYKWKENERQIIVRIHGPDPSAPRGSNANQSWVVRVRKAGKNMDSNGNFHPDGIWNPRSPHNNEALANDTHIPIQTPSGSNDYTR